MDTPGSSSQSQPVNNRDNHQSIQFVVPGMGSNHCAGLVSSSIRRLAGITDISTNIANHKVTVRFDPATAGAEATQDAIGKAG